MCGALYCHNKRDGGGGKEGNTAFRAASWKVKDCLILLQLAFRAFRFMHLHPQGRFGGCCMLVRTYKKIHLNKDRDHTMCIVQR